MAVTPKQVYTALINAGASTTQAVGIMANGIAESGLNPEAIGDGGTSFGTWQEHGTQYAGLVTGNPAADLAAQVRVLALNGGFGAAAGSAGSQAAGNFAANYERCVGCQQGGAQYNQRVASAATVSGWVSSGKWPTSAGSAGGPGGGSGSGSPNGPDCAFGPKLPLVGQICLLQRATIRHMVGGGLMVAGGLVSMAGVILLAAFAFRASGAQQAAAQIGGTFTPVGRAYRRSTATRNAAAATSARTARAETQRGNRQARAAAGSPRSQARAVSGRAPRRPPPAAAARPPRAEHHE